MTPPESGAPALGLQLYTLRSVSGPLDDLLARVAALGYDGVETVATQGVSAWALRSALERHALRFASAHVALRALRDDLPGTLETYGAAGAEMIVVPWLDPADRPASRSGWERLGRELAGWGASASAAGLSLAYHHHGFELDETFGVTPLEVLLEVADPDHLSLELDVAWLVHAAQDPVAWIDRVGARSRRLHAKDLLPGPYRDGDAPWADVGDGVIDWPAVVAAAARAGTPWLLVEHDTPTHPWRSAERSLAALRRTLAS